MRAELFVAALVIGLMPSCSHAEDYSVEAGTSDLDCAVAVSDIRQAGMGELVSADVKILRCNGKDVPLANGNVGQDGMLATKDLGKVKLKGTGFQAISVFVTPSQKDAIKKFAEGK